MILPGIKARQAIEKSTEMCYNYQDKKIKKR